MKYTALEGDCKKVYSIILFNVWTQKRAVLPVCSEIKPWFKSFWPASSCNDFLRQTCVIIFNVARWSSRTLARYSVFDSKTLWYCMILLPAVCCFKMAARIYSSEWAHKQQWKSYTASPLRRWVTFLEKVKLISCGNTHFCWRGQLAFMLQFRLVQQSLPSLLIKAVIQLYIMFPILQRKIIAS